MVDTMYTSILKGFGFVLGCSIISYAIVTFLRLVLFGMSEAAEAAVLLWSPLAWGWLAWVFSYTIEGRKNVMNKVYALMNEMEVDMNELKEKVDDKEKED